MAKAPAFQFYPGDWLRDTALRSCSVCARGLWIDMLCIMHQGEPYGHLTINGRALDTATLARMVGETPRRIEPWLLELAAAKVFSQDEAGTIYSRRMVNDEHLRRLRAEGGKKGGNPALMVNRKVENKDNLQANLQPTPSSSSSSSSSSSVKESPKGDSGTPPRRLTFHPPTVDEVRAYCQARGNGVDPQLFVDKYTANGWMVGKTRMKDWQAAVRTWERNDYSKPSPESRIASADDADRHNFHGAGE